MNFDAETPISDFSGISPWDIKLSELTGSVNGGFGKFEVEKAAGELIKFLRDRNKGWRPFGLSMLMKFYMREHLNLDTMLFGLLGDWLDDDLSLIAPPRYLVHGYEAIWVTYEFIHRCYYHEPSAARRNA